LTDKERAYIDKFEKVWKEFFDKPESQYINIIGREPGDTLDNSVREMKMDGQTKYITSGRRMIHAHILIQIKHYTKLQFNAQVFREYLTKEMNLPSTYVHIEHVSDSRVPSWIHLQREQRFARLNKKLFLSSYLYKCYINENQKELVMV